ncbi:hypothetical protein BV494_20540 [Rahnella sikkimica]|uniref:Uncharacterized protein n=1 Tax=Rahnella sikkimica TaxID=1805933 RepID=A0A2L1UW13_9GAMM|nr:hypothetical protein BV494_20540 [Rahnella sikkimica]
MAGKVLRLAAGAGMIDGISTLLFRFSSAFCCSFLPFLFSLPKKRAKKNGSLSYRLCMDV